MVLTLQLLMWKMGLKTLNYFSCFLAHDQGYLGPVSPKLPYCPKYRSNSTLRWFCQLNKAAFNVNHGVGDFVSLYICPKYPRTDKTPPSDSLFPVLRLHLIWHIELSILDYFSCVLSYDLWYLNPVSPNCTNVPNTLKQA